MTPPASPEPTGPPSAPIGMWAPSGPMMKPPSPKPLPTLPEQAAKMAPNVIGKIRARRVIDDSR
jgi:hypothetical protein